MTPTPPIDSVHAAVLAGGTETPYRRAGTGRPVLLLVSGSAPDASEELFRALSQSFRVIMPELPDTGDPGELAQWLRDVIDGLGLVSPVIVVDPQSAGAE